MCWGWSGLSCKSSDIYSDCSCFDYIDFDGVAKHLIKVLGIPASAVKSDQDVFAAREERAAQQQQMMEQQQLAQGAESMGKAAPMVAAVNE